MSISPIITFRAGMCDLDSSTSPPKVIAKPTAGYLYLYEEDGLIHFCWRPRNALMSEPELDLVMVPSDGVFKPYTGPDLNSSSATKSPTNGRIFVLKFSSSTQRHLFWLQSKSQHAHGDSSWFSPRDLKIGSIVNSLLQGEEVNIQEEVANISNDRGEGGDETMEDAAPEGHSDVQGNFGSGDPFIGDPGEEGEEAREGGADGGRAAQIAVQNLLRSLQGSEFANNRQDQPQGKIFTTLPDLLPPSETIPMIESADTALVDNLLTHLPPELLLLSQEADDFSSTDPSSETVKAAMEALSLDQKKEILKKVLRSPQFSQSLASLTQALRDGGLPAVSDALHIPIKDGGFIRRGGVPLGGGDAVEAFMDGIKASVEKDIDVEKKDEEDERRMDTE